MIYALYGVAVYAFFLATFVYAIGFVSNLPLLPKTIDSGPPDPLAAALLVNVALLGVFALQHSVMARRSFKRWWTRFVPEPVERSSYVLAASLALALLQWQWRPIAAPMVWQVADPMARVLIQALFWTGWGVLLLATFLINHFELFGLRQVWVHLRGTRLPPADFRTPFIYRHVRHPIYLGFVIAFWATPDMSAGHLLFALATTAYILVGIWFEERDLVAQFGERYRAYRAQTGMLLPRLFARRGGPARP